MFDLGDSEILILLFLALLVLGPDEIPSLARRVGLWVGRMRRLWSNVRADLDREVGLGALEKVAGDEQNTGTGGQGDPR
ncbi:MAG: Sec-independent protein translocase protein TatB [Gammaproteobacteria bacterium]|nr:Sec-independent protein translocase protein TatB [Gammaproteobacteria bacterium]